MSTVLINLLPWREARREEEKKWFVALFVGALLLAAAILLGVHLYFSKEISFQNKMNRQLQVEISSLDRKIIQIKTLKEEKGRLLARLLVIEDLQKMRPLIVKIFDELLKVIPDNVDFETVDKVGDLITIFGKAESNAAVANLMRNIKHSSLFMEPNLEIIRSPSDAKQGVITTARREFTLRLKTNPLAK